MPESSSVSASGKHHQVAPRSGLPSANSSARAKNRTLLDTHHNIASTFFSVGRTSDLDEAFLIAARDGEYDKIETLLQRRNDVLVSVDVRDKQNGNTPIIWAAKRGHTKIVQLLLRHGADITLRNYEGQTAVELASPQIRQLLLDAIDRGGSHRNLLQAAWQGNASLIRRILSDTRTVDINCRNGDGLTPLLLVTRDQQLFEKLESHVKEYNPADVVSNLLEHRGDPNAVDSEGRTPLHYASSTKAVNARDVVNLLIDEGSAIEARDRRNFAPIHCASQSGNVDVVFSLLEGGSDANLRGYAGATPLHISAINGHNEVATELLQHGADVTLVDDSGLTPVDVAKTKKVKATLKQAWTEATQKKISEKDLGPLRPPSREGLRMSWESKPSSKPKRGGQVIFDHEERDFSRVLHRGHKSGENSVLSARMSASSLLARGTYPPPGARMGGDAPVAVSEIKLSLPTVSAQGSEVGTPRKLSNPERPPPLEEQLLRDAAEGHSTPAPPTARSSKSISPRSAATKRLHPITPSHGGKRELKFGPGTKNHDGICTRIGSTDKHTVLHKSASEPARLLPVTILGLELDDDQKVRQKRVSSAKGQHHRNHSDPRPYSPAPSSIADSVSTIYDDVYRKGRSGSRASIITISDELDDYPYAGSPSKLNPLRTPSASDRARLRIPHTIREGPTISKKKPIVYDLDQGQVYQFPTPKPVLPPTPSSLRAGQAQFSDLLLTDLSQDFSAASSKDNSPRSEEDSDSEEDSSEEDSNEETTDSEEGEEDDEEEDTSDSDGDSGEDDEEDDSEEESEEEFPLSYAEPDDLTRSKSILKDGTFDIETTRVRRSDDSGYPEERTSGSNNSSIRSSSGSSLSGDQADPAGGEGETKVRKAENNNQHGALNKNTGESRVSGVSRVGGTNSRNQPVRMVSSRDVQTTKEEISAKLQSIAKQNAVVAAQIAENASKLSQTLKQHRPASAVKAKKNVEPTGAVTTNDNPTMRGVSKPNRTATGGNVAPKTETSKVSVNNSSAGRTNTKGESSPSKSVDEAKNVPKRHTISSAAKTRPASGKCVPARTSGPNTKPLPSKPGTGQTEIPSAKINCEAISAQSDCQSSAKQPETSAGQKTQVSRTVNVNAHTTSLPCTKTSSSETGASANSPGVKTMPSVENSVVNETQNREQQKTNINSTVSNTTCKSVTPKSTLVSTSTTNVVVSAPTGLKDSSNRNEESKDLPGNVTSQSADGLGLKQDKADKGPEKNSDPCGKPLSKGKSVSGCTSTTTMVVSLRKPGCGTSCKPTLKVGKPGSLSRGSTVASRPGSARHQMSKCGDNSRRQSSAIRSMAVSGRAAKTVAAGGVANSQEHQVPVVTHTVQINVNPVNDSEQQKTSDSNPMLNADTKASSIVTSSVSASVSSSLSTREGLTPVSSSTMGGGNKITVMMPIVDNQEKATNQNKVFPAEHKGPVIYDPFETIKAEQSKASGGQETKGRVRSGRKNRITPGNTKRGAGSECRDGRQPSGGKKRSSAKIKTGDGDKTSRPKSGKKLKGKKRKKSAKDRAALAKGNMSSVAEFNEVTAVQAFKIEQQNLSDSDVDNQRVRDVPNSQGDFDMGQDRRRSAKSSRTRKSQRGVRNPRNGESDGMTDGFTDENDSDNGVLGLLDGEDRHAARGKATHKPLGSDMEKIWEAEMRARATSPNQNMPTLVPQTIKAIDKFARSVNKADLDSMMEADSGSVGRNSKAPPRPPPPKKVSNINAMVTSTTEIHSLKKNSQRPAVPPRPDFSSKNNSGPKPANEVDSKCDQEYEYQNKRKNSAEERSRNLDNELEESNSIDSYTKSTALPMRSASYSSIPDAHTPQYNTNIEDLAAPEPAENVEKVDLETDVKTYSKTKAPRSKQREEAEIDSMIDEILKTTPASTVSLSSLRSSSSTLVGTSGLTIEEAKSRFENGLRASMDGRIFQEVPVSRSNQEQFRYHVSRSVDCLPLGNKERAHPTELENLHHDFSIDKEDQEQLENLMKSLKRMELNINIEDIHPEVRGAGRGFPASSRDRPPVPHKTSVSPKISDVSRPLQPGGRVDNSRNEKSPRFVRQRGDSLRIEAGVKIEVQNATKDFDSVGSDFLSDAFSIASSVADPDTSIVPKDGRVVTSRLGRRSAQGREGSAMTTSSSIDETSEMIQWKRGNMLGKGAYGTVWCGLTNSGELIAVKQIELDVEDMDKAELEYEKIQEEVELLKTLQHKNIVGYLGTSLEENIVSIFMQFVPGGSIANILARFGALEEEVFALYTVQILEGVAYLHNNNVIHRDIKGGNIMLMQNGVIKLIDFGCAKRLCLNMNMLNNSSNRLLKSMRGTPYWMAPEVVKETGYGTKSDVWSIGCTVFEMATRKPPWADVPPMSAIFAIGSDKPVPQLPEKFSDEARSFVQQCLQRDQSARPSANELLLHAFVAKKKKR